MKIYPLTDFPERFLQLKSLHLYDESKKIFIKNKDFFVFDVAEAEIANNSIKLKLEGYDSINDVQEFVNMFVVIEQSQKKKLGKGQFYFYELVGFDVYTEDKLIGKVVAFENFGGGDLMKIKLIKPVTEEDTYIPYRKEFIEEIDEKEKRIYVKVIEGLI